MLYGEIIELLQLYKILLLFFKINLKLECGLAGHITSLLFIIAFYFVNSFGLSFNGH